jgi:hypothetical protein
MENTKMRIRERDGSLYLVRSEYQSNKLPGGAGRSVETGLGWIPSWATLDEISLLKLRDGITLSAEERSELEAYLTKKNPPKDPVEMAAIWLEKSVSEVADLPLRDRQSRIRKVRPLWNKLSALAGTKQLRP